MMDYVLVHIIDLQWSYISKKLEITGGISKCCSAQSFVYTLPTFHESHC